MKHKTTSDRNLKSTMEDNFLDTYRKLFLIAKAVIPEEGEVPEAPLLQSGAPNLLTHMNVPHLATGPKDPLLAAEKQILDALPTLPSLVSRPLQRCDQALPSGIRAGMNALEGLSRIGVVCASRLSGR